MKSWNDASLDESVRVSVGSRRGAGGCMRAVGITLAIGCMVGFWGRDWVSAKFGDGERGNGVTEHFEWSKITPSQDLIFHRCFQDFECAKLSVPLDYFNNTYPNSTISVAITKLPATVPISSPLYGGPILVNPGGPGGPGALFNLLVGKNLRAIVDAASSDTNYEALRHFDILGFDPRGIGWTEPPAYCMADPAASWSWTLRESTEGILGSSDAALGRLWAMSKSWGASCKEASDAESGWDIKSYMSTASVARDMLTIVERHAEWVSKNLASRHQTDTALYTPAQARLQYWGFSYGTFLGSTFASMFPSRVGRVVLDGVVSSYDYLHSLGNGSLTDSQKAMDSFYTYCISTSCPLSSPNATFSATKARVETIVQSLYHNPLPINSISGPEILTYSDIKNILFSACYTPVVTFPFLVPLLLAIEARKGAILDQLGAGYRGTHIYSCPINGSAPIVSYTDAVPTFAVLCGDGDDQTSTSLSEFEAYWRLMDNMSPTAGAIWSMLRMRCLSWHIKSLAPFRGPFGGKTANPILFVSSTADPVTPLRSARVMHEMFPGSGLLVSDHAGHCSLSSPDPCTLGNVAVYFQMGLVPQEGKVCVPEKSPWSLNSTDPESRFYDPSLAGMRIEEMGEVGVEVLEARREVPRKIVENDLFGVERLVGGRGVRGLLGVM